MSEDRTDILAAPELWASLTRTPERRRRDRPTLLLCGNGMSAEAVPALDAAGYNIVVLTEFPSDRGLGAADAVFPVNTKDPRAVREMIPALDRLLGCPAGIFSLCWDCPVSVGLLAEHYSLPAASVATAELASHKDRRLERLRESSIPIPDYRICSAEAECLAHYRSMDCSVAVVKPRRLSSSKGVTRAGNEDQLRAAYRVARSFQPEGPLVIEEFVDGTEHSAEGMMIEGRFHPTGFSDRQFEYDLFRPHFVEYGDVLPSALPPSAREQFFSVVGRSALALGITDGPVKADLKWSRERGPILLELTPRLGGPRYGTEVIPLHSGVSILRALVEYSTGCSINTGAFVPVRSRGVVSRSVLRYPPGRLNGFSGLADATRIAGYYDFKAWASGGLELTGELRGPTFGSGDLGYFICVGDSREQALLRAAEIEKCYRVQTDSTATQVASDGYAER